MKFIIPIILGVFFISLTSATFPGECSSILFPNAEPVTFSLVSGNSQILNYLNWTKNGTNITYCFSQNSITGNFQFKWENTEEVTVNFGGSGGYKVQKNITIPKNETTNETISQINETEPIDEIPIQEPETPKDKSTNKIKALIFALSTIILIAIIVYTLKKRKNTNERRLENTENENK